MAEHIEELCCDPAENLERFVVCKPFLIKFLSEVWGNNTEKEQEN